MHVSFHTISYSRIIALRRRHARPQPQIYFVVVFLSLPLSFFTLLFLRRETVLSYPASATSTNILTRIRAILRLQNCILS